MVLKHINKSTPSHFTDSAVELVKWPNNLSNPLNDKVVAIQTTRYSPVHSLKAQSLKAQSLKAQSLKVQPNEQHSSQLSDHNYHSLPYGNFNLGNHVGDNVTQVEDNREILTKYINQQYSVTQATTQSTTHPTSNIKNMERAKIQWLEQVHGNKVVTVTSVAEKPLIADASITRDKNIALAIMTADCLPILLAHHNGQEVAAIHGGWRPLAASIIANTIEQMQSEPCDIVAWIGPCIGPLSFEVGFEVKEAFSQQSLSFEDAFVEQENGKYLANLHTIARLQLLSLGVNSISSLSECTYQQTDKYYSYRKNKVTGRMASIICRR